MDRDFGTNDKGLLQRVPVEEQVMCGGEGGKGVAETWQHSRCTS